VRVEDDATHEEEEADHQVRGSLAGFFGKHFGDRIVLQILIELCHATSDLGTERVIGVVFSW